MRSADGRRGEVGVGFAHMRKSSTCMYLLAPLMSLAIAGAAGCGSDDEYEPPSDGPQAIEPVSDAMPFMLDSGMKTRARLVIRDEATWKETWNELAEGASKPVRPEIDFERRAVLVVTTGEKATSNYKITVDQVVLSMGDASIEVTETAPGKGCLLLPSASSPATVVTVPRFEGEATFSDDMVVKDCN